MSRPRLSHLRFEDGVLKTAFLASVAATAAILRGGLVWSADPCGRRWRVLAVIVLLMALGALLSNRRIWLLISVVNNLALLLFFKYGRFVVENLNALFAWLHWSATAGTLHADALWLFLRAAGRHFFFHLPVAELHD